MSPDRREGHGLKKAQGEPLSAPPLPAPLPPLPPPEGMESSEFLKFPLPGELVRGAAECGYLRLTPVQERLVPEMVADHDVVARTKTGSGRTIAYLMPALARVRKPELCQVLIMAPTRTLAAQIAKDARRIAVHMPIVVVACLDGARRGSAEADDLAAGPTVVVGLPERVAEHADRGEVALDGVEVLVLDMADRVTPPGLAAVESVLLRTTQRRVTAILTEDIPAALDEFLAHNFADAVHIDPEGAAGIPEQTFHAVSVEDRLDALDALVAADHPDRGVVLVRDKFVSDRVADRLKRRDGGARAYHSGVPETKRARMLKDFHAGRFTWLVATDSASAAISPQRVRYVVNYDVPETPAEYARRLAWVAPIGKVAQMRTLVVPDQRPLLAALAEAFGGKTPSTTPVPGFEPKPAAAPARPARRAVEGKDADRETWRPAWAGVRRHPPSRGSGGGAAAR